MTGYDKFKQSKDQLKQDIGDVVEIKEKIEPITNETGMKQMDEELLALMRKDAEQQTEEDGGLQPWLKIFDASRSTYTLRDGSTPHHGYFFYQPEEVEFEEVYMHILTISRGFRAEGMKGEDGQIKYPYQHIISGLLIDEMKLKSFWMTISGGARLNKMWEFQKELAKKARAGISKFALVIKVKTERVTVKDKDGKDRVAQVPVFDFVLDENNQPNMAQDMKTYQFLKQKREETKVHLEAYITRKQVVDDIIDAPAPSMAVTTEVGQLPSAESTEPLF